VGPAHYRHHPSWGATTAASVEEEPSRQIARTGESGREFATAALVIGYLHFAFTALLIVAGVTSSS
jgi:hypothetical protein